jgi:hypothetical protein
VLRADKRTQQPMVAVTMMGGSGIKSSKMDSNKTAAGVGDESA